MRISDWSSDVCSSDLLLIAEAPHRSPAARIEPPRRRDVGAAGTDDRAKPRPRGNPQIVRNAVIAAQVERAANIGSDAPLQRCLRRQEKRGAPTIAQVPQIVGRLLANLARDRPDPISPSLRFAVGSVSRGLVLRPSLQRS